MTEEPTPAQIEAAAKAMSEASSGFFSEGSWRHLAREALIAAAGAAPQEPMSTPSKYINPSLPGMIRNLWKSDPSEASVRTALGLAGDLIQELIDLRAAPVQVDESKIAEVIKASAGEWGDASHVPDVLSQYISRAVVEWLRGGGR